MATRRPFAYVPLRKHWEQQHHVAHRLRHYDARNQIEYRDLTAHRAAEVLRQLVEATVTYRAVPEGGARRAALQIAALLRENPRSRPVRTG